MKRNRRVSKFLKEEDTDPLSVVVNLFDVAMVFAVALMVAMVMHMNMTEVFGQEDFTIVKNPGKENMENFSFYPYVAEREVFLYNSCCNDLLNIYL